MTILRRAHVRGAHVIVLLLVTGAVVGSSVALGLTRTDRVPSCEPVALETVQAQRDAYGAIVLLIGDSIVNGWALATFTPPPDHPLWCLRSPLSVLALLQHDNRLNGLTFVAGGVPGHAGTLPDPAQVRRSIESGFIRSGDVLVIEDAGLHSDDPLGYLHQLLEIRRAATQHHAVTVVLVTVPDYVDPGRSADAVNHKWSIDVGGMTFNDAIRRAASEPLPGALGRTTLMDWMQHADPARHALLQAHNIDTFHGDGIHPNAIGQLQFVGLLLEAIGVRLENTRAVERIVASAPDLLDHEAHIKGRGWGPDPAVAWSRRMLLHPRSEAP